jgi:hypothetical protein|tara:strand:+ start:432 stop:1013 length:582 start_codon:yes stop_codon:yes gene_type:complete
MKRSIIYYWILKFCNNRIKILNNLQHKYVDTICENGGDILEIGFGAGTTSNAIQKHNIKTHTIVEIDSYFYDKLKKWSMNKSNVITIKGDWKDSIPEGKKYDGIIFDLSDSPDNDPNRKYILKKIIDSHTRKGTRLVCSTDRLFDKELYTKEGHKHEEIKGLYPKLKWYNILSKLVPNEVINRKKKKGVIIYI